MVVQNTQSQLFVAELKKCGVVIDNEKELSSRLAEVQGWQTAFATLFRHGERIGIAIRLTTKAQAAKLQRLMKRFAFPEKLVSQISANRLTHF